MPLGAKRSGRGRHTRPSSNSTRFSRYSFLRKRRLSLWCGSLRRSNTKCSPPATRRCFSCDRDDRSLRTRVAFSRRSCPPSWCASSGFFRARHFSEWLGGSTSQIDARGAWFAAVFSQRVLHAVPVSSSLGVGGKRGPRRGVPRGE